MTELGAELRASLRARRDASDAAAYRPTREELIERVIKIHEIALRDTIAATRWLTGLPFVDADRVFMSGASHGGVQTLLAAEADLGARAYVAFAPGAIGWPGNPELHARLVRATRAAVAPILVAQARNDIDLGPSRTLGAVLRAKGGLNAASVFAPYGGTPEDGHSGFACEGTDVWGETVLAFLAAAPG